MDLRNRVAVVTGAASGIGYALAQYCVQLGMHVVLADSNVTLLCDSVEKLTGKGSEVMGVVCDVTQAESVNHLARQTLERFESIDWLINNAGISGNLGPVWDIAAANIQKVIDTNLYGAIYTLQAFLPAMVNQDCRIINIASLYGLCSGSNFAPYVISKQALVALSESLHFDLNQAGKDNISVSVACPSFTDTKLLDNSKPLGEDNIHHTINELLQRSKSASDVAKSIIDGVMRNEFYVLPDKEVKSYCQTRLDDILMQRAPTPHSLEKILTKLVKRHQLKPVEPQPD